MSSLWHGLLPVPLPRPKVSRKRHAGDLRSVVVSRSGDGDTTRWGPYRGRATATQRYHRNARSLKAGLQQMGYI